MQLLFCRGRKRPGQHDGLGGAVPRGPVFARPPSGAQGPAAATPLVGPGSARADIRPFLLPRQGQAALTSCLSLPISRPHPLQPRRPAAAPGHTQTAPALSLHLTSFPVTAPSSDAFSVPSQGPKEALFPTVRFPGDICASLQASSRASLPSSLNWESRVLAQVQWWTRCPACQAQALALLGSRRPRLEVPPDFSRCFPLTSHQGDICQVSCFVCTFLFSLQCDSLKAQQRCVGQSKNKSCFSFS